MIPRPFRAAAAAGLLLLAAAAAAAQQTDLPARDRPLRARPAPLYAVGKEDGHGWEVFASVGGIGFDGRDNLYVFDRGNARVVVFDTQGRFVREVGRRGDGPGEFSTPLRMAVAPDGTVIVSDAGRGAFSVFGPDGRFLRSVPFEAGWVASGAMTVHPQGGVVLRMQPLSAGRPGAAQLRWYPLRPQARTTSLLTAPAAEPGTRREVFAPGLHFAVLPTGGLAWANGTDYRVRLSGGGAIRRALRPRRVTQEDRDAEVERRREALAGGRGITVAGTNGAALPAGIRNQIATAQVAGLQFAEVMPVIAGLAADPAGTLWIARTPSGPGAEGAIDLVAVGGRYLGTLTGVALPDAFSRSGRIATLETDDLGVQRVVVQRLPAAWQ